MLGDLHLRPREDCADEAGWGSALVTRAVSPEQQHRLPWLRLEQHKTWLRVTTAVRAGRVRVAPGGAR